jgi:hypothetical protein
MSRGVLTIFSSAAGTYRGGTAATGEGVPAAGELSVTIAAKHQLTATFTLGGIRYTGRAPLDGDETSDVLLRAKGHDPLTLRLGLRREGTRLLDAWISGPDLLHAATCSPAPKGGR